MPDFLNDTKIRLETLSLYKVLEGLIHNINTPLNIIMGYSQQLKKQYPELPHLEEVNKAALKIDDMVQACSRYLIQRLDSDKISFDLRLWLQDEMKLLNNILEIKHALHFEVNIPDYEIFVTSNPFVLGLFFESIVLHIRKHLETGKGRNVLTISINVSDNQVQLDLMQPESAAQDSDIASYMAELQKELEILMGISFSDYFPLGWRMNNEQEIIMTLKR